MTLLPLVTLTVVGPAKPISPDLFGIFFEDINYSADGGLYAEMVQNRSFEYNSIEKKEWHALTGWTEVKEQSGEGRVSLRTGFPLHPHNPHFVSLVVQKGQVGLRNDGFGGMVLRKGEVYDLSLFACAFAGKPGEIQVRLEDPQGKTLASASLAAPKPDWSKLTAELKPNADTTQGRLVVLASGQGATGIDVVSLFPRKTFKGRPNGMREDLAQAIADLKPKFIRFPGGCLVHGGWLGLSCLYNWKETIGPIETRREQPNLWGYHQTMGLGYFEYFQYCEDIGAKPLPVVHAGISCQNTDFNWGRGQEAVPLTEMKTVIQDVLDLVEYANGPATSRWGKLRAAAGHPKPFGLEYLAIGNEEAITPQFELRFKMIHDAVKAKYPKLKLIGTVGPNPAGEDFDAGWKIAREQKLGYVDEHFYMPPDWFWNNLNRYDAYSRSEAKVYAGEYAAHENDRANSLLAALAEAAMLTSYERNGDVVQLASYAPLLAKEEHTQWRPDMIYFDNTQICRTTNYYVQQLFMHNSGDRYLASTLEGAEGTVASSVVQDSATKDVMVKLVSRNEQPLKVRLNLASVKGLGKKATRTVLTGDLMAANEFGKVPKVLPQTDEIVLTSDSTIEVAPHSLTVLRFHR